MFLKINFYRFTFTTSRWKKNLWVSEGRNYFNLSSKLGPGVNQNFYTYPPIVPLGDLSQFHVEFTFVISTFEVRVSDRVSSTRYRE